MLFLVYDVHVCVCKWYYCYSGDCGSWTKFFFTFISCFLEFKTITTCDNENLTAQMHGLYTCHQVVKKYGVPRDCHVLPLSFSTCQLRFAIYLHAGIADQDDYWNVA